MTRRFSRRGFLRGAGGALVGLPLMSSLPAMATSRALAGPPKRLLIFVSPNGCVQSQRHTSTDETAFTFGQGLAPLPPHRDQ